MNRKLRKLALATAVAFAALATAAHADDDKKGVLGGIGGLLGGKKGGTDTGKLLEAGSDAVKGLTLSDADIAKLGAESALAYDKKSKVLPAGNKYAQRLAKITSGYTSEDGLKLNYKVYQSDTVNAFALPDGSVRVYTGLMDLMDDDELRFVIGHEIGHVKYGHSKARFKTAYLTQAARKGVASQGNAAGAVASSDLGGVVENVINAQFSQSNELESDQYGLALLKKRGLNQKAAVTSMQKLEKLDGGKKGGASSIVSSHPPSAKRVERLEKAIAKN